MAEAAAEAGFDLDLNHPWSSVNNCTEGGTRRRLKLELNKRGYVGTDDEVAILMRGGGLIYGIGALIDRNGRLQERKGDPANELWLGWA